MTENMFNEVEKSKKDNIGAKHILHLKEKIF